ncbi:roundabout homolog 2-like [Osmerus eperlanus]|uniref:roundabout homolog 2-like n=1 Tax=Osmerus eperlanus TaxID=29151 RepID=UPI002E11B6E0
MQSMLQAHLDELTRAYQYEVAKQAWHMKGSPRLAKAPGPALGFMSATLGSELGTALQSEEEEEEDEGYGMSRKLSGFEYTPGRSVDHLDGSGNGFSQRGRPGSSGSVEGGALGSHSLGHQRGPPTGKKGRAETVGTLPRRRDTSSEGPPLAQDPLHSVGARLHGQWAPGASGPPEECMVSTLERQHLAPWTAPSRGTLGRGGHHRPEHRPNGLPPASGTDKTYGDR